MVRFLSRSLGSAEVNSFLFANLKNKNKNTAVAKLPYKSVWVTKVGQLVCGFVFFYFYLLFLNFGICSTGQKSSLSFFFWSIHFLNEKFVYNKEKECEKKKGKAPPCLARS